MEFLQGIDQKLFLFLNGLHCSFMDGLMWPISMSKILWIPFYATLIFFMIWKRKKYWWITILSIALMILLSDQLSGLIKDTVQRLRPSHNPAIENLVHVLRNYRGGSFGFVSSHAANTFATATFVSLFFAKRWLTIVMFCWAILVSYSRIYLGVHYPLDILGGAILGFSIGAGIFILERFVYVRVSSPKS